MNCLKLACLALALGAASATYADFDISPLVQNGKITTGGVTHETDVNPITGATTPSDFHLYYTGYWRVFGFAFGDVDPQFPTYTLDPGINNEPGTYRDPYTLLDSISTTGSGLPIGSSIGFQALSDLEIWNGDGFSPVPAGENILIQNGAYPAITVGTGTGTPGITVKTFATDDHIHVHMSSLLQAPGTPTDGLYMFSARLTSSDPGVQPSDPIWLVYSFNDDSQQDTAIAWANANLAPEPGSVILIGLAAPGLLRRRRRGA